MAYVGFYEQSVIPQNLVAISSVSYLVGTLMLSPDLDLPHSIPTKNWSGFRFIWSGYHRLFRHRGKSHSFIFSTLSKLSYLVVVSTLAAFVSLALVRYLLHHDIIEALSFSYQQIEEWIQEGIQYLTIPLHRRVATAIFVGVTLSDWTHIFLDRYLPKMRRR